MSEQYKKFGELSRAEQLELVEHVLDGGDVEALIEGIWSNPNLKELDCLYFHNKFPTRRAKSELELLREQRDKLDEKIKKFEGGISVGDIVINSLDASKKEYEVLRSCLYEDAFIAGSVVYSKDQLNAQFIKVK